MRESLLPLLKCPSGCESELTLAVIDRNMDDITTGSLSCRGCSRSYAIREGIACLLPSDLEEKSGSKTKSDENLMDDSARKRTEMKARDEQVGLYDGMWYLNLFGLIEIPVTLLHMSLEPGHLLLEAGCGTGRMTRQFASRCRRLVAVDYSRESLRVCAAKLRRSGIKNVDLLQADICKLPLRTETMDRVVSCQVLEHIPSDESRAAAVKDLARVLKEDGYLTLSAYQNSFWMRKFGAKEGEHEGGIYFYRFDRQELAELLSSALKVEKITGSLVYHYIARCRKLRIPN